MSRKSGFILSRLGELLSTSRKCTFLGSRETPPPGGSPGPYCGGTPWRGSPTLEPGAIGPIPPFRVGNEAEIGPRTAPGRNDLPSLVPTSPESRFRPGGVRGAPGAPRGPPGPPGPPGPRPPGPPGGDPPGGTPREGGPGTMSRWVRGQAPNQALRAMMKSVPDLPGSVPPKAFTTDLPTSGGSGGCPPGPRSGETGGHGARCPRSGRKWAGAPTPPGL